jgi:xanthine dehydrogenase YagS FAD-binding subunit
VRSVDGRVEDPRVVLGGVAPIPWRSREAERAIVGKPLDHRSAAAAADAAVGNADPLEQNGYKIPLVRSIVEAGLLAL